jgi:hypothetical protein
MITSVTAIGSRFIRVSWTPVSEASGYVVKYSPDASFTNDAGAVAVVAPATAVVLSGLRGNTTYYVRVQSTGTAKYVESLFSPSSTATTGIASNDETVSHLHNWLTVLQSEFQNVSTLVPQLETTELNTTDRKRLNGSGVRRYGFIEKVYEVSSDYPQFWPAFTNDGEKLNGMVHEIDVLRNLLIWFRIASRVVGDLLLIAGDDAFRLAGAYYAAARDGARRKNPEAAQVFEMLRLFWRRRRNTSQEPTEREVVRDFHALLRGTKDGEIVVRNESDPCHQRNNKVIKGEKVIIDNTQRKPRGGVKIVETEEVE